MCARVWFRGREVDTVGELRDLVSEVVFIRTGQFPNTCCLCVVDFAATAMASGCEFIADDIGDYQLRLPHTEGELDQLAERIREV